jgi:putative membrane protein
MRKMFGFYAALMAMTLVSFVFAMQVAKQDSEFMMKAAQSDMAEIMTSNLALQKSQNAEVRRFAQMMIDEHTRTSGELKTLAADKNVTLPADVDAKQRSMMSKLTALSGERFDNEYMKGQVKMHEAAVKLFQREADRGTDADVKGWAAKTLPALQSHLTMARTSAYTVKNTRGGGGGNTTGGGGSSSNMNHE